jgi:hypothetical protein
MHCRPSFTRSFRSPAASVAASVAHASMLIASLAPLAGCGGGAGSDVDAASPPIDASFASLDAGSGVTSDAGTSAHLDAASVSSDAASSHDAFAPPSRDLRCGDAIPEGAEVAPPLPAYSGGTCPAIAPGRNTIRSGGVDPRVRRRGSERLRPERAAARGLHVALAAGQRGLDGHARPGTGERERAPLRRGRAREPRRSRHPRAVRGRVRSTVALPRERERGARRARSGLLRRHARVRERGLRDRRQLRLVGGGERRGALERPARPAPW